MSPHRWRLLALLLYLTQLLRPARAACECGYASTANATTALFTDLLESDFLRLADIAPNTDWRTQVFNVSATAARGVYGQAAELRNVVSNPLANRTASTGPGVRGGEPGLQLVVRGGVPAADGAVPGAEVDSAREDMLWGSYRASLKLSSVPGTCAAFFWYFNDTQEIDIEFLSAQFNFFTRSFPVHLVLQSRPPVHIVANLPFDPTAAFHEFRFDLLPAGIAFYADATPLAVLPAALAPTQPGHLALAHWSNGNAAWSAGPPAADAEMAVRYVRAYFNSSSGGRQRDFEARCGELGGLGRPGTVCPIPDAPPDGGEPVLFKDGGNMTNNQTVYRDSRAGRKRPGVVALVAVAVGVLVGGW